MTISVAAIAGDIQLFATATMTISVAAIAGDIQLPAPAKTGGKPLNEALAARQTIRAFSTEPLTDQELSDLLWAANGYNRPDAKKRTAPTAVNRQEVDLYVCRADGAYLWDSAANVLKQVTDKDLRGFTGRMDQGDKNFALVAPVAIVYVIDYERQGMQSRPQDAFKYASVDCGFIGQNVYLHCASTGLGTVFLGMINPKELSAGLGLPATRVPLFAQTVGHVK
jgi:nitroreductase